MDEDSKLIYGKQYKYLKRYKKQLIFEITLENGDSIVNMYKGKLLPDRLALSTPYKGPCESLKTASISFFDKGGRYFHNEDLVQQINEILKPIYVKYQEQLKLSGDEQRTGRKHDRIIIEVTVSGIRNLCNNTDVCLSNSHFFTEIYNCLYDIAYKNNISRTIIPVYSD